MSFAILQKFSDPVLVVHPAPPKVEDWIKLVRFVVSKCLKKNIKIEDSEEFSDGLVGLWQATLNYEQSFGSFSTYAYDCIMNKIIDGIRSRKTQKKLEVYLDDLEKIPYKEEKTEIEISFSGTEAEKRDVEIAKRYFINGESLTDIAKEMECTKAYVHFCKESGLKILRKELTNGSQAINRRNHKESSR